MAFTQDFSQGAFQTGGGGQGASARGGDIGSHNMTINYYYQNPSESEPKGPGELYVSLAPNPLDAVSPSQTPIAPHPSLPNANQLLQLQPVIAALQQQGISQADIIAMLSGKLTTSLPELQSGVNAVVQPARLDSTLKDADAAALASAFREHFRAKAAGDLENITTPELQGSDNVITEPLLSMSGPRKHPVDSKTFAVENETAVFGSKARESDVDLSEMQPAAMRSELSNSEAAALASAFREVLHAKAAENTSSTEFISPSSSGPSKSRVKISFVNNSESWIMYRYTEEDDQKEGYLKGFEIAAPTELLLNIPYLFTLKVGRHVRTVSRTFYEEGDFDLSEAFDSEP